jgi:energy-coupling factor transporter transmembrane protein EcfT
MNIDVISKQQMSAGFWWTWGISLAAITSLIAQLLPLMMISAFVVLIVFKLAESDNEVTRFKWLLKAAVAIAFFRFTLQILFGTPMGTDVLITLPSAQLPDFLAGLRIGGAITTLSVEYGLMQALRLANLVIIIAGVATISNPRNLLQRIPRNFAEFGLLATMTLNFVPQIAHDAERLNRANRWRGQNSSKLRQLGRNLIPLTETALDRSVNLGAALALRGYGTNPQKMQWRMYAILWSVGLALGFGWFAADLDFGLTPLVLLIFQLVLTFLMLKSTTFKFNPQFLKTFIPLVLLVFWIIANYNLVLINSQTVSWDLRQTINSILILGTFAALLRLTKVGTDD